MLRGWSRVDEPEAYWGAGWQRERTARYGDRTGTPEVSSEESSRAATTSLLNCGGRGGETAAYDLSDPVAWSDLLDGDEVDESDRAGTGSAGSDEPDFCGVGRPKAAADSKSPLSGYTSLQLVDALQSTHIGHPFKDPFTLHSWKRTASSGKKNCACACHIASSFPPGLTVTW